jgi:phosphoglycerate kinase
MLDKQDLIGKKVLVRVDFNVPLNAKHEITDDTRIRMAIPTIRELIGRGAKIILMSHLGRPLKDLDDNGNIKAKYSLRYLVPTIESLCNKQVEFITSSLMDDAAAQISPNPDIITLLENTRFYKGEEKGDPDLAAKMAALADYYINDAFGAAHREHASTATIARYFDAAHKDFGLLMDKEVKNISKILSDPMHPFCAIIGGAKVSDKILLLDNLLDKVDTILIGGGMAFTFIKAQGGQIGNSLCEEDKQDLALDLLKKAELKNVRIILPSDVKATDSFNNDAAVQFCPIDKIPAGWLGLDIGPASIASFESEIARSKTILWNGPAGVFEFSNFNQGTFAIAKAVAQATTQGAFSVVGGGDSVSAINKAGLEDKISFVSTGGGAMLEMIEGKVLPGIAAMEK